MSKIILTDFETTGLDPVRHEIVEMAAIVFDSHTLDIEIEFERKVMPMFPERADPKALKVNGYSEREWKANGAVYLNTALSEYLSITKDCHFMSYNVAFDMGFLLQAIRTTGLGAPGTRAPNLCLQTMAYTMMPHQGMFSWSMKNVCAKLGIPPEPAMHRAMNGVMAEFEIYKKLMK